MSCRSKKNKRFDREQLETHLVPALESLVQALLDHEGNVSHLQFTADVTTLARKLHSESVIFLFRIIIIWLAEIKGLLPLENPYYHQRSLSRLMSLVEETDRVSREQSSVRSFALWEDLWTLFEVLEQGTCNDQLIMKPLGSWLFSSSSLPLLRMLRAPNDAIQQFLKRVLLVFRSFTGTEMKGKTETNELEEITWLGSIHELLLYLQPSIALEDLVVTQVTPSKVKYVPRRLVKEVDLLKHEVVRSISRGQFYYQNWNGTRKGSGSYYSPAELTTFLVESVLEPLAKGKEPSQILELKVLDPAVGTGAFLVAATRYLTAQYLRSMKSRHDSMRGKMQEVDERTVRKLIVKHCIFGVDVDDLAVELTKVSLWFLINQQNLALDFFNDNIRVGNSLLGFTVLQSEELKLLARFWARSDDSALNVREALDQMSRASLKSLLDAFILAHLNDSDVKKKQKTGVNILENEQGTFHEVEHCNDDSLATRNWKIFHWSLEFPDMFKRGGFDAIITNPPWNILKPNSNEFFSRFLPEYRSYKKKDRLKIMDELLSTNKTVRDQWKQYIEEIKSLSRYFKNSGLFQKQYRGDLNLYKLFLERCYNLLRNGGFLGMIVPSALYTDLGARDLRKMLFHQSQLQFLFSLENREGIFGIHKSYKIVLFVAKKEQPSASHAFKIGFFIGARPPHLKRSLLPAAALASRGHAPKREELADLLRYLKKNGMQVNLPLIKSWNPSTLALVEVKNEMDLDIIKKLHDGHLRFNSSARGLPWHVRLNREFDMTNDLKHFLTAKAARQRVKDTHLPLEVLPRDYSNINHEIVNTMSRSSLLPLYEGKMIWQFNPFFAPARYWVATPPPKPLKAVGDQPLPPYRAAFRAISGSTNERTLVACVLPRAYHGNTLQSLMISITDPQDHQMNEQVLQLYACGMLNSLVLDWIVRLKVTSGLNYHFVYSLPFPRLTPKHPIFRQLVPRIARLSCVTLDFAELWTKTFQHEWILEVSETSAIKDWKHLTPQWHPRTALNDFIMFKNETRDGRTRALVRAEIDALIARLFQLDKEELVHMLDAFPVLEKKETKYTGGFRTKELLLSRYDDFLSF